jgi:hypothetical protein
LDLLGQGLHYYQVDPGHQRSLHQRDQWHRSGLVRQNSLGQQGLEHRPVQQVRILEFVGPQLVLDKQALVLVLVLSKEQEQRKQVMVLSKQVAGNKIDQRHR